MRTPALFVAVLLLTIATPTLGGYGPPEHCEIPHVAHAAERVRHPALNTDKLYCWAHIDYADDGKWRAVDLTRCDPTLIAAAWETIGRLAPQGGINTRKCSARSNGVCLTNRC